jgi:hypothetical protein
MIGTIAFDYRSADDIVLATPHWHIETAGDIVRWFAQYEAYLGPFYRPMDMVLQLDDFEVDTVVGVQWGSARARMQNLYTRFTCRVSSKKQVRLFINTSGVRHGVSTDEAPNLDAAIAQIKQARQRLAPRELCRGPIAV